jgi:type III restriction enzyme
LKGSGYAEGTLFPWVVSDFSLIDAIESGIVKVPRVPVVDNAMSGDAPTYRNLWKHIRDELPKKGRKTAALDGAPNLPVELDGALRALYGNYEKTYRAWEENAEARAQGRTPPVMIVVCSNTNVSKLVYDHVAGWEKTLADGSTLVVPGQLPIFSNERDGAWTPRPNTILIDSQQLESGEGMSADFKRIAAREIEEFKAEYRERFPGRSAEDISDEDLLREVMNTVGKSGKLGEHVKCVISVSMLTEGWDANTVTHVLGVRAFGTQLLCEQVVGRGLRRVSYATNDEGLLEPEYAEVYGVPFSFIPASGSQSEPKIGPVPTRVRALAERDHLRIEFPKLTGYRYEITEDKLASRFDKESELVLSTKNIPTMTESRPIVGESSIGTLDDLKQRRTQEVAFLLAKLVLEKYFRADGEQREDRTHMHRFDAEVQMWMFPQVLRISKQWLESCVVCQDDTFPQLLLLVEYAHDAADRIYGSMVRAQDGEQYLTPTLQAYDPLGSTDGVDFDTTRPVYETSPAKCHVSHVVLDSGWEAKMAQTLEGMDEVERYVKNHNLGFQVPYTLEGVERNYVPDFIARVNDGHGADDLLNLVIEVSGEKRKDKAAKVAAVRDLWVPAVNNHGGFGRWAFVEISDPYDAKSLIRSMLSSLANAHEKELVG